MTASQLLLSTLILLIIVRTIIVYKRGSFSKNFLVIWLCLWTSVIVLIFQQELVIQIAHEVGISRGVDLVIYISLIVIFYLIYQMMIWFYDIDRKITELARKITLKGSEKKEK